MMHKKKAHHTDPRAEARMKFNRHCIPINHTDAIYAVFLFLKINKTWKCLGYFDPKFYIFI